jgi:hypothetical protein
MRRGLNPSGLHGPVAPWHSHSGIFVLKGIVLSTQLRLEYKSTQEPWN